jgi:nucleoside-diphosphate-sugar epimerase
MGAPLALPDSPEGLSETTIGIWKIFSGSDIPQPGNVVQSTFVDVRDVARLHLWVAENASKSNGQRYLVIAGMQSSQGIADILRENYPERRDIIQKGTPGQGYPSNFQFPKGGIEFDASKAVEATGQEWIPFRKTVLDAAKAFEKYL